MKLREKVIITLTLWLVMYLDRYATAGLVSVSAEALKPLVDKIWENNAND